MKRFIVLLALCTTLSAQTSLIDAVKGQTKLNDDNFLIRGFSQIDRSDYLPNQYKSLADQPLDFPLRRGVCALSPLTLITLFTETGLEENDKILIVGDESSYIGAALSQAGLSVYLIDPTAKPSPGYDVKRSRSDNGWISMAPFDYILVTNVREETPALLMNQLNARGTLLVPLIAKDNLQCWFKIEAKDEAFTFAMLKSASIFPLF